MNDLKIGTVFTPDEWAKFAIEKYSLFDDWIAGKTIFDPTMGEGNLLDALVSYGLEKKYALSQLPVHNLYGLELNTGIFKTAFNNFKKKYGINMKNNFINNNIMQFNNKSFDILFGNPPWCNFVDLPGGYKEKVKRSFFDYGLIDNPKKLLLGGSRIDIAALVVQKCIVENLNPNGKAVFFLPLSLFLNDGAHAQFRKFNANKTLYSLYSIYDFENLRVFTDIATRYGLAMFEKKQKQPAPIPYYRFEKNHWNKYKAISLKEGGPLLVPSDTNKTITIPQIKVLSQQKPRQGLNPCGAIKVFVFDKCENIDKINCKINNADIVPQKYIYPLITGSNFKNTTDPQKWVLLPYNNKTGKPLSSTEIEDEPLLKAYLVKHRTVLENRKGTMIQAHIKRGIWWALLGVGEYSFCNYKIVWEAYGKKTFKPQLFTGDWQANQALQAFIPCNDLNEARHLLKKLSDPAVEQYLLASKMAGTMNWAQPGKISAILKFNP